MVHDHNLQRTGNSAWLDRVHTRRWVTIKIWYPSTTLRTLMMPHSRFLLRVISVYTTQLRSIFTNCESITWVSKTLSQKASAQ